MDITRALSKEGGFAIDGELGRLEFVPPCLVKYEPNFAAMPFEGSLVIATYCVPTEPGWVRPLANVLLDNKARLGWTLAEQALGVFINYPLPPWVGHILSSVVLHQDAGLLYGQSRNLRAKGYNFARKQPPPASSSSSGGGSSSSDFGGEEGGDAASTESLLDVSVAYDRLAFTPTAADKGVVSFRSWLRRHGGDGIPWRCDDELPPRGSEDIFDMWHAHTKHCSQCQAALKQLNFIKASGLTVVGAGVLLMPQGGERTATVLAAAAVAAAAHYITRLFYRYEYSHADEFGPLDWYLELTDQRR